jgi:RNA polymerase sigma-70 factor (ECF subfamily)
MAGWSDSRTSISLLEALRHEPADAQAWMRFVRRYRPQIYGWCREWGLQRADADDVAQDVLVKLTGAMGRFHYDPARCFRAWLKTVTQHARNDLMARRHRRTEARPLPTPEAVVAPKGGESWVDHERLDRAMLRVRARVAAPTWEAFRLTALEGLAGAEASRRLRMPVASVFVAKHRVQKMLREELGV